MKITGKYEKAVYVFFSKNSKYIRNTAIKIKQVNYFIPLEVEDLISFSHFKLLESENKLEYFKCKSDDATHEAFFKRKIYKYMWSYCNSYKTKNHQILNNIINPDDNEIILNNIDENYSYEELLSFLNPLEFMVLYEIKVNKTKRNVISKKYKISKKKLQKIENAARLKICKHFNIII